MHCNGMKAPISTFPNLIVYFWGRKAAFLFSFFFFLFTSTSSPSCLLRPNRITPNTIPCAHICLVQISKCAYQICKCLNLNASKFPQNTFTGSGFPCSFEHRSYFSFLSSPKTRWIWSVNEIGQIDDDDSFDLRSPGRRFVLTHFGFSILCEPTRKWLTFSVFAFDGEWNGVKGNVDGRVAGEKTYSDINRNNLPTLAYAKHSAAL